MKKTLAFVVAALATTVSASAYAEDGGSAPFSVGITGGSLGIGPEVGYRFSEKLGVRANATFLNISHEIDSSGINYDGKAKLKSGGVMLDLYPFGGGFRVSGGVRINGNEARAVATPTQNVTVGGTSYTPAQVGTLRAETDINNLAPTLTIGYGGGLSRGITFGIEAGAMFQGSVKIKNVVSSTGAIAQADLDREARSIEDDIDGFKVYPVLQLSLGYRF